MSPTHRALLFTFVFFSFTNAIAHEPATPPAQKSAPQKTEQRYICPMDSDVHSTKPGKCPKCGMKLVPAKPDEKAN